MRTIRFQFALKDWYEYLTLSSQGLSQSFIAGVDCWKVPYLQQAPPTQHAAELSSQHGASATQQSAPGTQQSAVAVTQHSLAASQHSLPSAQQGKPAVQVEQLPQSVQEQSTQLTQGVAVPATVVEFMPSEIIAARKATELRTSNWRNMEYLQKM